MRNEERGMRNEERGMRNEGLELDLMQDMVLILIERWLGQ